MQQTNIDKPTAVIAACAMSVAAVLVFALLPVITGVIADHFALDDEQIGLIAGAYFGTYAVISATAGLWVRKVSWKMTRIVGFGFMLLGVVTSAQAPSFLLVCAGLAVTAVGAALLYPVAMTLVSDMTHMDRVYAFKLSAEQLIPAAILLALTALVGGVVGLSDLFLVLLLVVVLMFLASLKVPDAGSHKHDQPSSNADTPLAGYLALAALAVNFAGYAGLWAFLERLGTSEGFDPDFVALWLSVGLITAGVGPLGAAWLAERVGRLGPLVLGTLVSLATLVWLTDGLSEQSYALVLTLLPLTYCFAISYLLSVVGAVDCNGYIAGLMPFALAVGAAAGPAAFGFVRAGDGPVVLVMGGLIAVGGLMMAVIQWRHQAELIGELT